MQKENLKEILELHEKWLNDEPEGVCQLIGYDENGKEIYEGDSNG